MTLSIRDIAIYTAVIAAVSMAATKYFWPSIQTQVKIEEKEVIKKDIHTVIKEVVKPDGTIVKETTIVDNSKETTTKKMEATTYKKNDWYVAAGAEAKLNQLDMQYYKVEVNRRILGDIFVGATANTNGVVGLQVGFQF